MNCSAGWSRRAGLCRRLAVGECSELVATADCQSAIRQTASLRYLSISLLAEILFLSVIQCQEFAHGWQRFGLRWQSAAATPLSVRLVASKSVVAPALRDSRRSPKFVVAAQAALDSSVSIRG